MDGFSIPSKNSPITFATAYIDKSANSPMSSSNDTKKCANIINQYFEKEEETKKTIRSQLIELKREDEKEKSKADEAERMLSNLINWGYRDSKRSLRVAFETRIGLVKGVKEQLEYVKEETGNISELIDKYKSQLKDNSSNDYAEKSVHLLNNVLKSTFPKYIVEEPIYGLAKALHTLYNKFTYGGASAQLEGLGDNFTNESLGLVNLGKEPQKIIDAIDEAIVKVDSVLKKLEDKYYNFFDRRYEYSSDKMEATSCEDIEKWLADSIANNELEDKIIDLNKVDIRSRYTKVDLYI